MGHANITTFPWVFPIEIPYRIIILAMAYQKVSGAKIAKVIPMGNIFCACPTWLFIASHIIRTCHKNWFSQTSTANKY